jgi:hypothetical protein
MSIANYWGVGNASTVQELRNFIIKFPPSILCIQQSQISGARVESLASSFCFDKTFTIDSDGRSGGLNNEINIDILGYSQYHIDVSVTGIWESQWRLTNVYGEAQTSERYKT